jgi:hypothetical protein
VALTSAQLVTLSTQIARAPGYTSQAGQLLNAILSDLAQTYDFALARLLSSIREVIQGAVRIRSLQIF